MPFLVSYRHQPRPSKKRGHEEGAKLWEFTANWHRLVSRQIVSIWGYGKFQTCLYELVDNKNLFYILIFWFPNITDEPETLYWEIMLSI